MAALTSAVASGGGNILANAQYSSPESQEFCMRLRIDADVEADQLRALLEPVAATFEATLGVREETDRRRALVMVSKHDHCLRDLLYRRESNELPVDIALVVSNHPDVAPLVEAAGIDFVHLPVSAATKQSAESQLLDLIEEHDIDFVVLARYMQILSNDLCERLDGRIINIHHSFLPGFKGAKPYHQAWERGVKLIGATAHFVTSDLDEGPIITQGVEPVTYRETPEQMVALGRDIERAVLNRAVCAYGEDRIFLLRNGRTVIFD